MMRGIAMRLVSGRAFGAVLAAAVLASPALVRAGTDLAAVIQPGPQLKVGKLPNGLTYYVQRNREPARRLELRLVLKAGSIVEDEDQQGLAHFVEHMAFNGSTHFRKHELVSWMQSIGMQFGADLNAYTSQDETVYLLPVPTTDKTQVEKAFTVLEDWAHGLSLNPEDIDKERDIVLEEARTRYGVGERMRRQLWPRLLAGTRYPERLPIGKEDILRSFKPETLRRFYRDWYRPDLMAVVAVGDIDPAEAERLIVAHFGGLRNPVQERPRVYEDLKPYQSTEALVLLDPELTGRQIGLNYPAHYAPDPATYGSYRRKLIKRIFADLMSERLDELAQLPEPPFVAAGSGLERPTARHEAYAASLTLGAGGSAPALAALFREHRRLREQGFTQEELERARKRILRHYESLFNASGTIKSASYADECIRNFLYNEEIPGVAAEYRLVQAFLPGIGLEELNAFVRDAIPAASNKVVVYMGADRPETPAPTGAALLAEVAAAEKTDVGARTVRALPSQLMARPAAPGRIVAERQDKALGLTRLTLSNGLEVVLKPTDFNKDQVLLRAQRFGGQALFELKDLQNARWASTLVTHMGLGELTQNEIAKVLAGREANVSLDIDAETESAAGASGSSMEDVEAMLQLLWLRFNGARRDEGVYTSLMRRQAETLRHREAMPEARFDDAVTDLLYGKHPYEPRASSLADLAQVDLDRSLALYRQRFASAKGFTFVLVGNFRIERIKPLLAAYLGSLSTADLPLAPRDMKLRFATGVVKREFKAGTEPKSTVTLHFTGPALWSPDEQLRMDALMEIMGIRVTDQLREKLGLIYSSTMGGAIYRLPWQHYWIAVHLPTGPEKVDATVAAIFADIERLQRDGPDPAELAKVRSHWRQSWPQALRDNGYWLSVLSSAALYGDDPQRLLVRQERADAITVEDIRQAARRYFNTGNYVQAVLSPEDPETPQALAGAVTAR